MSSVNWNDLLAHLKVVVPAGSVTSYKALSRHFYGHDNGTQAIASMLKAAVAADAHHATWTNRVIGADGSIVDVNGLADQLKEEGWLLPLKEVRV
ncbi:hypothetical protein [Aeromonas veronii]|uniref:hypothetical protein n=1 Tax=Aeromonas veronii TaxID=654 RepID=UPI003B9E6AAA